MTTKQITIDSKYSNRKIYFLKDILEGRTYFAGEYAISDKITKHMANENPNGTGDSSTLLSHAILDVKDVIFPPRVENLLYNWISYFDLVVIDTTVEDRDNIIPFRANQFLPDGTRAPHDMQLEVKAGDPILFRHRALMQYRERVEFTRKSLDLSMFQHEIGGVKRFTPESTNEVREALIEIQKSMHNRNERIYINPARINSKDEPTLREVSALLIRLFRNVKIANNLLNVPAVKEGILPTIGQLCFNYDSFISTLYDIKRKFKVGDKLPIIYGKEIYFVQVTENPPIPEDLDIMALTEEDIEKYFYISVRDARVNERLEIVMDEIEEQNLKAQAREEIKVRKEAEEEGYRFIEANETHKKRILLDYSGSAFELVINADRIKRREVILLPPAIAGMTTEDGSLDTTGMPTKEELVYNYKNSIISGPSMIWLDPNDYVYANTKEDLSAGADFIRICREQEQLTARRRGEEKKFVDLIEVFNSI